MIPRRGRELAGAAGFFAIAAVLFTWPLAARISRGMPDLWDDKLNAWIFHWDFHQIFRDPLHLFDANIFHPARGALAFSENLFGAAVFGFPLFAAGASTLVTANVLMLLGMALSGVAAWALARDVTGDAASSLVAGLVYAFVPWRIAQLPHVQFQWGAFLALLLLFLLRYLDSGRKRDAVLFALFFAWNAVTNVHYAVFSGLLVMLVLAHGALSRDRPLFRRRARNVAFALVAAGAAVLPFYLPYQAASRRYRMRRGEDEIAFYSGRPVDFLTAGRQNRLYAPLTQKLAHAEGDFFPGLVPLGLAVVAVVAMRRLRPPASPRPAPIEGRRRRSARALDVLVAAGLLSWAGLCLLGRESLGPIQLRDPGRLLVFVAVLLLLRLLLCFPRASRYASLGDLFRRSRIPPAVLLFLLIASLGVVVALGSHTPFYRFLVQSAGAIFRSIRVPARAITLFDLALGVLAAWGLSLSTSGARPAVRRGAIAAAMLAITLEYRAFPIQISPVDAEAAPVYAWLARLPLPGAAVEWPITDDIEPEHVFRSTAHWKPLVNGYSGFGPPDYQRLTALLAARHIPDTIWPEMRRLDATVLLFHAMETQDDNRSKYLDAVRRGVADGALVPLGKFPRSGTDVADFAFRLEGAPVFDARVPAANVLASAGDALREMSDLETRLSPPFGALERPRENEEVAAGSWGFGWALDDSGVAGVTVSIDGGEAARCILHQAFPGVDAVYPKFPDSRLPGFGFGVPAAAPGEHTLVVEIEGKDGGKTVIRRPIRVR